MSDIDKTPEPTVRLEKTGAAARRAETRSEPPTALPANGIRRPHYLIGVAAAVLGVLAVAFGVSWQHAAGDLNALRDDQADRARAAEVARDYTLRSLTYDYRELPAFFDAVRRDASAGLTQRYDDVHDTLATIMTEAQVVATGNVLGTSVEATGNDQFVVTVFATQRTQNVQQPEPVTKPNLLTVTVAEYDGTWQVVDYGPKDTVVKDGTAK
ncbi:MULTISPECIES: hypothetical protein [unclassified Nocardia]|uniref:hypothetical protein n=1 Tax=unclassified Nocardia TaxID=2637762 RepID=UPI0024A85DBB|nr:MULTISPECIES: hypothetical protein [unclassified Nocardia]